MTALADRQAICVQTVTCLGLLGTAASAYVGGAADFSGVRGMREVVPVGTPPHIRNSMNMA